MGTLLRNKSQTAKKGFTLNYSSDCHASNPHTWVSIKRELDMSPVQQKMRYEFAEGQKKTSWMNDLKGPLHSPEVKKIEDVCSALWERKGKRLRSQWVFWFGEALGLSSKELNLYAWAVEAIHTATLLHDDVIDKASLRRGGPSANALFDNTLPILSGDYLLSDAIFQLSEKGHPLLLKMMCSAVKEVTQGEILQYEQRYRFPESSEYFEKLNRLKTSALLKWAAQVGSVLIMGQEEPKITSLALQYGELYQFTDDILDIRGTSTKESWQDLKEGKINEATFYLLRNCPELKSLLEKDFLERKVSDNFIGILKTKLTAGFESGLEEKLHRRKQRCLETLEGLTHPKLKKTLDALVRFTVERLS